MSENVQNIQQSHEKSDDKVKSGGRILEEKKILLEGEKYQLWLRKMKSTFTPKQLTAGKPDNLSGKNKSKDICERRKTQKLPWQC